MMVHDHGVISGHGGRILSREKAANTAFEIAHSYIEHIFDHHRFLDNNISEDDMKFCPALRSWLME